MIKSLIPQISKELGRSTALVFQQLMQWFKNNEVVYRTNQELSEDLEGILSTATIQRAKKKLEDAGYLTISFDKGHKRTTHYRLTQKAKDFFAEAKAATKKVVETVVQKVKKPFTGTPKAPVTPTESHGLANTAGMKEAFENYGKKPEGATTMPDILKRFVKPKQVEETPDVKKPAPENTGTGLFGSIFKRPVSDQHIKNYETLEGAKNFKEDF